MSRTSTDGQPPKLVLGSYPKQLVHAAGVTELPVTLVKDPLVGFCASILNVEIPMNKKSTRCFFKDFTI